MAKNKYQRVSYKDAQSMLKKHIWNAENKNTIEINNCPFGPVVYLSEKYVMKLLKKITR